MNRSPGVLGRAEFSREENELDCLFGCNAEAPVATGATATLRVGNAGALPPFIVRGDDPTVARVSGTSQIELLRAGVVRILLEEDPGGALVGEFVVTVSDVHRVASTQRLLIATDGSSVPVPSLASSASSTPAVSG